MTKKRNSGKDVVRGQMRPLTRDQVQAIGTRLQAMEEWRDYALFRVGIDSMLRASDLVRILVEEITDHHSLMVVHQAQVRMKKTGDVATFPLSEKTRAAVKQWLDCREHRGSDWLFYGRPWWEPLTEVRYRQIAKTWFRSIGLPARHYSTHSLRRTKATIMYDETNDIKAVSELLGHRDTKMTEKYIGMTRAKAVAMAAKIDV
jgi:integrase